MTFNDIIDSIGIKPYYLDLEYGQAIYCADCRDILPSIRGVSAVVTDPPYELGFMGKSWDSKGISFDPEVWQLIRESCKSGAIMLSFGGTRTSHRIAVAIEDAGWEIRDTIMWVYGSGFPKSHNVAGAIDKKLGYGDRGHRIATANRYHPDGTLEPDGELLPPYEAKSPEAKLWDGYGTALKPAYEPIILAMKPIEGTFANNALKHGVAGLNIDECRIGVESHIVHGKEAGKFQPIGGRTIKDYHEVQGRFPANFIHDGSDEVMELFPDRKAGGVVKGDEPSRTGDNGIYGSWGRVANKPFSDNGSAARFFYCAKASRAERDAGLDKSVIIDIIEVWKENNITREAKLAQLQVIMETLPPKVIVESGTKNNTVLEWSISWFGNSLMAKYQKDIASIMTIGTGSITTSQICDWLVFLLTNEYMGDVSLKRMDGGSLVGNAGNSNQLTISISERMASHLGVNHVTSETQLKISVSARHLGHPTVKPLALMTYLCKLVKMPEYNLILDPFCGSGSTLLACRKLGIRSIGIDSDEKSCEIAAKRLSQSVMRLA